MNRGRNANRISRVVLVGLSLALVAGCGSFLPKPSRTPTPTGTPEPQATETSVATSSPTPKPEQVAIAAFVALVTSGKLTFHATGKGRIYAIASDVALSGSLDVSGANAAATFTQKFGTPVVVATRVVAGIAWLKVGSAAWRKRGRANTQSRPPFADITTTDQVTFLETSKQAGPPAYVVKILNTHFYDPTIIRATNLTEEKVQRTTLQLTIDARGRPIAGSWSMDATGRVSRQLQEVGIELTLTFSKVGAKIAVKKP